MSDPAIERTEVGRLSLALLGLCDTCPEERGCEPMSTACPIGMARKVLATFSAKNERVMAEFDFDAVGQIPQQLDARRSELQQVFRFIPTLCNRCMFHADKCFLNITYMLIEHALCGEYRKQASVRPVDISEARSPEMGA